MPFSSSQTDSSKRHLLGQQCCTGASVSEKTQAMAAYAHSAHNAHTWPGTKWTTQQYLSPGWDAGLTVSYSAPHWWDRLTPLHKQAGGVGVTARRHDFILPLPARSLSGSATQKHARNEHRNTRSRFKRRCHRSPRCGSLSGGWMLSIGVTEISALGTQKKQKKLGNVSVSIWVRQHKEAGDGDGGPLTFTNTRIGVQLVYWSWHWHNIPVAVHK